MNLSIFRGINDLAGHSLFYDGLMVFFAVGAIFILAAVVVSIAAYMFYKKQYLQSMALVASCVLALVISEIIAVAFPESRPFVEHNVNLLIHHAANSSLPSTHTTMAFAGAFAVFWFSKYKIVGGTLIALAAVVGFSRVFVGVHYPFDVLGGIAVAAISVAITDVVVRLISRQRASRQTQE